MLTIHCENCDEAGQYRNELAAKDDGWNDISVNGVNGPFGNEAFGLCAICES